MENNFSVMKESAISIIKEVVSKYNSDNYCIVDKINTGDYFDVLRNSMYEYSGNYILAERFYKKSKCVPEIVKTKVISKDSIEALIKFEGALKKIKADESQVDTEELKKIVDKVNNPDFNEEERKIFTYKESDVSSKKYTVISADEAIGDHVENVCGIYFDFAFALYRFIYQGIIPQGLEIVELENEDYYDILFKYV